jgi:hypothetical protein
MPAAGERVTWRRPVLLVAIYLGAAIALTWPLAISLTSHLGALQGPGDPYLNLWILGWGLQAWTTDPASVITGRVFDANIFYPAAGTLAYSDHFLLQALALAPVFAVTGDAVLCYNLLLIASIALSGAAMHALARAVTGSTAAALIAGLAWACWPYRTAHLLHIQLQALYFMPLALLCLHRVMARRRWRDAAGLAAALALQTIASVYYGLMTGVAVAVCAVVLAVATGQWRATALWSRLGAAALLSLVLAAPVLAPYARAQRAEGFGRTLFEAANHSASWQSYTQVPPVNLPYGRTQILAPRDPAEGARDRRSVEHQLFPGFILLGLAAAGLIRHVRGDARALVSSSLALVVAGGVLSFGPEGLRTVYAALHDNVYGFQAIRAPARFAVIAVLGLSLLAALGMRWLTRRRAGPVWVTALLPWLMMAEFVNAPLPLVPAPPRETSVGQWLASEPMPGAVLYVPLAIDFENTRYMVQSLEHRRPIVNGYSGQRPPFFSALVDSISDFPSPTALAAVHELDVRFVVSGAPVDAAGTEQSPLVERARFDEGIVYEVRWTPAAVAALGDGLGPPPPAPGAVPFTAGEVTRYDVHWEGGPVALSAGTVTLTVADAPEAGTRWRFEAQAETADWMSRFFQARDRFVTTADALLRPVEHTREIREGRRQLDRTYIYVRDARHVRIGATRDAAVASDALTLPLVADAARDALTALFYIRTLDLAPGASTTIPINEAGTSLIVEVSAVEAELIEHHGRPTPALRLEPRITRRLERRRPVAVTLWLSADRRRIPLRAIVDAGFGRVRVEMEEHR